jgi:hypothetical protein
VDELIPANYLVRLVFAQRNILVSEVDGGIDVILYGIGEVSLTDREQVRVTH